MLAALAVSTGVALAEPPAAPSAFDVARQSIADLDWANAIKLYEPLREQSTPGSAEWTEATFCLASAYHHVQPPAKNTIQRADDLYKEVAEKSQDQHYVARALLARGRIRELKDFDADPVDLDGAYAFYEQVMTRFAGQPIASEAALRAAASLVMAFDGPEFTKAKKGIALLEKWLADHPSDPLASLMWQYLGDTYYRTVADYKNMIRCYEMVDKLGWIDQGNQGAWYWRAAVVSERYLKDRDMAIKYYTKIVRETPNSGKAYEALIALKQLGAPMPSAPLLEDDLTRAPSTAPTTQPEATR